MANLLSKSMINKRFSEQYDKKLINLLFLIIFASCILINVDHGSLAGCSVELKEDLDINDFQFGILGSIAYCGIFFGSMAATGLFQ